MAEHFWLGGLCFTKAGTAATTGQKHQFPPNVVSITDTITIIEDMGNRIPDKSWMLYLLELFDSKNNLPVELNLICQFNDRDNFWAIFRGANRQKFTKVLPTVGHSYLRRIVMRRDKKAIEYSVTDTTEQETEEFVFNVQQDDKALSYVGRDHFSGLEWWNKSGNAPFPVRYKVEIGNLMHGQKSGDDWSEISYKPYDVLASDKDGIRGVEYPVSFQKPGIKDGKIAYTIELGKSVAGLRFVLPDSEQMAA
jgi:hypothetical protein